MAVPLLPARLEYTHGKPYAAGFGEAYASAEDGLAQARHVFLAGNGLPERWRDRERFVILETGFGLGLNFLATWQAWRRDPARCRRLHFVSIEAHPFAAADLRALHGDYPELRTEAQQLHACWPFLVPGAHRLELDGGNVVLTLFFSDVRVVRDLRMAADAVYLDGFSPAKNPEMWSPALLRAISRVAAPGATAAASTVAPPALDALATAGFSVEKRSGFAPNTQMLAARLVRNESKTWLSPDERESGLSRRETTSRLSHGRKATVIGAGLAGAAVCERLCARGWDVRLVERHAEPAQEASGNHAGTFHPIVTPDDSVFARMTRAGFLSSISRFEKLPSLRWDRCGVLQLARTDKEAASQQASIAALALPSDYAQWVTREEASAHAGVAVAAGGLWFPQAGWVQPRSLVAALLEACGDRLERVFATEVHDLSSEAAQDRVVVLAASHGTEKLKAVPHLRLRRVRGQVSHIPAGQMEAPHVVVLRGGFVLPPIDGICVAGASYDIDDDDPAPRAASHAGNVERLRGIFSALDLQEIPSEGRVGFRAVAPDRLPVVGELGGNVYGAFALGSRGLVWAALAAEVLASALEGEPLPIEGQLAAALDPGRFARRAQARLAGGREGSS